MQAQCARICGTMRHELYTYKYVVGKQKRSICIQQAEHRATPQGCRTALALVLNLS
jgi:hypothetical protein